MTKILQTVFRKELIWASSEQKPKNASQVKTDSLVMTFEFGKGGKAPAEVKKDSNKDAEAEEAVEVETNATLSKFLDAISNTIQQQGANKGKFIETLWQSLSEIGDILATYLGQALEKSNLTNDLRSFLISCFKDSEF